MHTNIALPSDVSNSVKRIETRCASYRQRTLPHRRAASRSKPPKPATGGKIGHCDIQAHCLTVNHPTVACQYSLAFGCAELREAHQKPVRFLSSAHPHP
nr:hypothetical protein [Methylomarinum sp. Ch1-1]MDP4520239.1 hypothetical protein [Methylomarinum sp. Ch1-1]